MMKTYDVTAEAAVVRVVAKVHASGGACLGTSIFLFYKIVDTGRARTTPFRADAILRNDEGGLSEPDGGD